MKYLRYFEEDIQLKLWDELPIKFQKEIVFHNNNWLVIKPKSFETLLSLSEGTEWRIKNINAKYHAINNFKPEQYPLNDSVYVNINKKTNERYLFDFYRSHFYDNDEEDIYLKEFFEKNKDLFNFYGEIVECSDVVKENNEYWVVVDEYKDFSDYFELDRNTRSDLIKIILSGDGFEIFQIDSYDSVDMDEYGLKVEGDNLILLKVILLLEKERNRKYHYQIEDIKDYDDVVSAVKEYNIKALKNFLLDCVLTANEQARESEAYESITDAIYDFFNLELGSAKWQNYKNSKNQKLWIKFKSNEAAYYAKFLMIRFDDSYSDDKIKYSPPYNGYDGDDKVKNEAFNTQLIEKDYGSSYITDKDIAEYYKKWLAMRDNDDLTEEEILKEMKYRINASKYNI